MEFCFDRFFGLLLKENNTFGFLNLGLYLTTSGEVWSFGCNDEGALGRDTTEEGSEYKIQKVDLPKDCVRITAGDSHSAFLLSDG